MKISKNIIYLLLLIYCSEKATCQIPSTPNSKGRWNIQIDEGLNHSWYYKWNIPNLDINPIHSNFTHIGVGYGFDKWLELSVGVNNLSYGYMDTIGLTDANGNYVGYAKHRVHNRVIQIPILFEIKPFSAIPLVVNIGCYFGFNYRNKATTTNSLIVAQPIKVKNKTDIGLMAGLKYYWFKNKKITIGNNLLVYNGLTNLYPNGYFCKKARGMTFSFVGRIQI